MNPIRALSVTIGASRKSRKDYQSATLRKLRDPAKFAGTRILSSISNEYFAGEARAQFCRGHRSFRRLSS